MPTGRGYRQTHDAPVIPVQLSGAAEDAVQQTEVHERATATMKGHRRRINAFIEWIKNNAPEYFRDGVIETSEQARSNQRLYLYGSKYDLVYTGLNVSVAKAFIACKKTKANGKHSTYDNLRKYHDAILFGSEKAHKPLPPSYERDMRVFLASCRKETVAMIKEGKVEMQEADAIPFQLYRKICFWAIESQDIFLWAWVCVEWNLMARSASVDPIGIQHFTRAEVGGIYSPTPNLKAVLSA